ncbi:MAG: right-handed parallel beta-helix repeat-containing protein [Blastocatellia bacterium]
MKSGINYYRKLLFMPCCTSRLPRRWLALVFSLAALFLFGTNVIAAINVESLGDGPPTPANCPGPNCTLRDAIAAAAPGETIIVAVIGQITLGGVELIIDKDLTIQGPGANLLAISGNDLSPVFFIERVEMGMRKPITVNLFDLTITRGNGGEGGGIFCRTGTLNLTNCHVTENVAGSGAGVFLQEGGGLFTACTFSKNVSNGDGGGIWFGWGTQTLTLVNCTVTGNDEGIRNAGFCGSSTLQVFNSTIANNTDAGIRTDADLDECMATATTILRSTILANNGPANLTKNGGGTKNIISQGYNLTSDNAGGFLLQPTDILNTNPQLAPLAYYGGTTPTMALPPTSSALDKGNSFGLVTDQRGFARTFNFPALANAADGTDIGAFELDSKSLFQVADPALCLNPGDLVGALISVLNVTGAQQQANIKATLPPGLTAVAGTCTANLPGQCTITPDGSMVTWDGVIPNGQSLSVTYRARIAANATPGALFITTDIVVLGGQKSTFVALVNTNCAPNSNPRVSDQKPGSLLVFPYYTSTIGGGSDTRLTISNISTAASTIANQTYVHLFLIDGTSCQAADFFLCLTPNATFSFKASEYDPGTTGYLIAVAVDAQGRPAQNNVLIGNAFVNTPQIADTYGAESFWANTSAVAIVNGNTATLYFDQLGYDAVPKQFTVEIQSPLNAVGQQVITASLSGDLTTSTLTGAAQVGTGQAFNEKELFSSFSGWLNGTCQARGTISTTAPRVPNGLGNLIKTGQSGALKFNVGGAVGLLLTPRGGAWTGIRTLHKTQTTATTLTIPIFVPVC